MKHVTYRGKHVDMELLRFKNQHQVAVGNLNMNARGDVLGRGGVIVKTREELLKENEIELTKPDFNPESQTASYAPEMDKLSDALLSTGKVAKSQVKDFTDDDSDFEPPSFEEKEEVQEEVKAPKRAPRKST